MATITKTTGGYKVVFLPPATPNVLPIIEYFMRILEEK